MIGWNELGVIVDLLSDAKSVCRLETFKLEVTVPSEKKLRELAWDCVEEGLLVNLHTRTSITITNKTGDREIWARVRT